MWENHQECSYGANLETPIEGKNQAFKNVNISFE